MRHISSTLNTIFVSLSEDVSFKLYDNLHI